ncbi:MAG: hypothetical protein EA411_08625 [Saprospirales bacterium]|nr:MAG: hypothetical protein EA411_08625 [Saprospirales bacterium]
MNQVTNTSASIRSAGHSINALAYRWMRWALVFLLLITFTGLSLRYYFLSEIPGFTFNNLKHMHSHVAMLGWAFMASVAMLLFYFIEHTRQLTQYKWVLRLNVIAVVGMSVSFPLQGYTFYSILFSTLHVIFAYWFSILFLRDLRHTRGPALATSFARWSVIWMMISTLGLWSVATVAAHPAGTATLYYMSIQWFLHFQFVGWFSYAVIAGLIMYCHRKGFVFNVPATTFLGVQTSLLLTYALSIKWSMSSPVLFYLNSLGVLIQLVAYYFILRELIRVVFGDEAFNNGIFSWLIKMGILTLVARIFIQTLVVIPAVADIAYTLRMFVVAFIHLIMVGFFTLTVVGLFGEQGYLKKNRISAVGWMLYMLAFVATEFLLFFQGTYLWTGMGFIPSFYNILFFASALFPLGISIALAGQLFGYKRKVTSFSNHKN